MAENNKRRGRPKKEKTENIIANEEKEFINMSAENNITSNTISNTANTTTNVTDRITMDAIQQRWAQIFGKYGKSGFDTVSRAWNLAWNQANNPFLQNARIKQSVAKPLKAQ